MIKSYLLFFLLITSSHLFSQKAYFMAGSNTTNYTFKSSEGVSATKLQSGSGSSYEMGISNPIFDQQIFYDISINLNEYNAIAGSPANSYQWDTKYVGVQNAVSFNFPVIDSFELMLKGGLNLSTIIYGKQIVNGAVYDLMGQDEFAGILFSPFVGIHTSYQVSDYGYLSLGYSFYKSLNPFNVSPDKLSFTTNQIQFGIHFNIEN